MSFGEAVKTCFSKYVTFAGRARRSEFWWFYLFTLIVSLVAYIVDRLIGWNVSNNVWTVNGQSYEVSTYTNPGWIQLIASLALVPDDLGVGAPPARPRRHRLVVVAAAAQLPLRPGHDHPGVRLYIQPGTPARTSTARTPGRPAAEQLPSAVAPKRCRARPQQRRAGRCNHADRPDVASRPGCGACSCWCRRSPAGPTTPARGVRRFDGGLFVGPGRPWFTTATGIPALAAARVKRRPSRPTATFPAPAVRGQRAPWRWPPPRVPAAPDSLKYTTSGFERPRAARTVHPRSPQVGGRAARRRRRGWRGLPKVASQGWLRAVGRGRRPAGSGIRRPGSGSAPAAVQVVTRQLPARWCSPSTFWGDDALEEARCSSSASARWPSLGCAAAKRRHPTKLGAPSSGGVPRVAREVLQRHRLVARL